MKRGAGRALTFWMFRTIYRLMSGATYEPIPSAFRPFERAAAFHIASRSNGEVLIRLGMDSGIGSPIAGV
jgi:hypothetical protein